MGSEPQSVAACVSTAVNQADMSAQHLSDPCFVLLLAVWLPPKTDVQSPESLPLCVLDLPLPQWERVKKAGMAPGPRSSFAMVAHKNRWAGVLVVHIMGLALLSISVHGQPQFPSLLYTLQDIRQPRTQY
jgi:hypothetical protein